MFFFYKSLIQTANIQKKLYMESFFFHKKLEIIILAVLRNSKDRWFQCCNFLIISEKSIMVPQKDALRQSGKKV